MKITERQLRRIIKETLHHMAAAAAASSERGRPGIRRRASKIDTTPDTSSMRSGSSSGSRTGTPQDLSGGKAEQMYADLRKGRSKEFFDIVDDIDMYTRARQVDVIMPEKTDENEIVVDMKTYNRDNQMGGFTEENYKEWVDNVCPILNHDMHFYRKFEEVWKGLSLMPESKLRQIIRNIIKESQDITSPQDLDYLANMGIESLDDAIEYAMGNNQVASESINRLMFRLIKESSSEDQKLMNAANLINNQIKDTSPEKLEIAGNKLSELQQEKDTRKRLQIVGAALQILGLSVAFAPMILWALGGMLAGHGVPETQAILDSMGFIGITLSTAFGFGAVQLGNELY